MTAEEIVKALYINDPWIQDADEGSYCFYCGNDKHNYFPHHLENCIWLEIEKEAERQMRLKKA